ncbi:MAG: hypothetical protein KDC46_07515 [Thermoleophilia bacterium]|nr:hypothetical protein [Thermoleophilia bacterium]
MYVAERHQRRESAFTIVEVLIGALLVTAVFAGAMYFIAGSGRSQQHALVRQRMASAADDIGQRVRADANWLRSHPECKVAPCDISDQFPIDPPRPGDPRFTAGVTVAPVDSRADTDPQTGRDSDGVTPDYYRIKVVVTLAPGEDAKWGAQSPFEALSTVDATAIGRAVGSITVQACEVVNQVDERMSIAGCDGGSGTRRDMTKQPSPCSSPFPLAWDDWLHARPVLPLGCNKAFDAGNAMNSYTTQVDLRGTNSVTFTLKRDASDGGPATVRTSADADSAAANGTFEFTGLPAGSYTLTVNPGKGRELWKTKTVPSALRTSVQANQAARALIVLRPVQGEGEYKVKVTKAVWIYRLKTFEDTDVYTESAGGYTVQTTTHYLYMRATKPERKVWNGPAWTGIVSMEPKPFDRYRANGTTVTQPTLVLPWVGSGTNNQPAVYTFADLPTGLHSLPTQQPTPDPAGDLTDFFGDLGKRTVHCTGGTPGGACGNFAWLDSSSTPDSWVSWHSEDGECYIESSVPQYPIVRKLQNAPGGHADRCSRDLIYINQKTGKKTVVENFLPRKDGTGGSTMVLSMWQETVCIAGCPPGTGAATGTIGYPDPSSGGSNPSVGSSSTPPVRTSTAPPKVSFTPPKTATNPSPAPVSLPAASAVPSANG